LTGREVPCNYCSKQVFLVYINGRGRGFEDPEGIQIHRCNEFQKNKISLPKKISNLERVVDILQKQLVVLLNDRKNHYQPVYTESLNEFLSSKEVKEFA